MNSRRENESGGFATSNRDREAKVQAFKTLMFKGTRDAQEVEKFLW